MLSTSRRLAAAIRHTSGLMSTDATPAQVLPALAAQRRGLAVPARAAHPGGDRARARRTRAPTAIFIAAALGIIPPAALMGKATEELAARSGPGIGGLLNVTFGNFPELVIAFFALLEGLQEVVKASIIGSIIGNILLVLGASMFVGGLRRDKQTFDRTAAERAVGDAAAGARGARDAGRLPARRRRRACRRSTTELVDFGSTVEHLSLAVAIVLIVSYMAGLIFSLRTHRALFNPHDGGGGERLAGACAAA